VVVSGTGTFNANVTAPSADISGGLSAGSVTSTGDINGTGAVLSGNVTTSSGNISCSTLSTSGLATISGGLTVAGACSISGDISGANLTINTVDVAGNFIFDSTTYTGTSAFAIKNTGGTNVFSGDVLTT
jgi:cytoskeletal protein CcmA (bactofilin family)